MTLSHLCESSVFIFFTTALNHPCRLNWEPSPLGLSAELLVGGKTKRYRSKMACAVSLWIRGRGGNRQEKATFRELCEKQGKDMGMQVAGFQRKARRLSVGVVIVRVAASSQTTLLHPSPTRTFHSDPDKTKAAIPAFAALRIP